MQFVKALVSKNDISGKQSAGNQRFVSTNLVGSSETIRVTMFERDFCEWLGGVIDGDGCLLVSREGYSRLEITTGLEDQPLLLFIKQKLGGGCRPTSGAKAYRYVIRNKPGMVNLVNCIGGNIRHSIRLHQLHDVCSVLGLQCIKPVILTKESHWFAGFFDADGTIGITLFEGYPRLYVSVINKYLYDIEYFKNTFGGNIFYDSAQNGYYKWVLHSRDEILSFYNNYVKHRPFRSRKAKRFFLLDDYFKLRDLQAYKSDNAQHKAWNYFMQKWKFEDEH